MFPLKGKGGDGWEQGGEVGCCFLWISSSALQRSEVDTNRVITTYRMPDGKGQGVKMSLWAWSRDQLGELFCSTCTSHLPAQVEYRPAGRLDGMISTALRSIFMNWFPPGSAMCGGVCVCVWFKHVIMAESWQSKHNHRVFQLYWPVASSLPSKQLVTEG